MRAFDFFEALMRLWRGSGASRHGRPLPTITYPTLKFVQQPPRNDEIAPKTLTIVAPGGKSKWAMFRCPCDCKSVITLPLQATKRPHWTCGKSKAGRPTLYPSIWRDVGCLSHFILEDGRIYWCGDSGVSPEEARRRQKALRGDSIA